MERRARCNCRGETPPRCSTSASADRVRYRYSHPRFWVSSPIHVSMLPLIHDPVASLGISFRTGNSFRYSETVTARTRSWLEIISYSCLLYTSDAADDLLCVDLGGRRIIKKK